jgi:hypothetical protein
MSTPCARASITVWISRGACRNPLDVTCTMCTGIPVTADAAMISCKPAIASGAGGAFEPGDAPGIPIVRM